MPDNMDINTSGLGATGITDGEVTMELDNNTGSLIQIPYEHYKVHEGQHYYIENFVELGNAETYALSFETPSGSRLCHVLFEIKSTTTTEIGLFGDVNITNNGSQLTPINGNGGSSNTSNVKVFHNETLTVTTTWLGSSKWGSAGGVKTFGGAAKREDEYICKAATTYAFIATSGGASNLLSYRIDWYEHVNRETF